MARATLPVWLCGLGGPLVWAAHFGLAYAAASIEQVCGVPGTARLTVLAATVLAVPIDLALIIAAARDRLPRMAQQPDPEAAAFWRGMTGVGAAVSLVAVLWQALPALLIG